VSTASDIATLKTQVATLKAQVGTLTAAVVALQQRLSRDETSLTDVRSQLSRVKKG
jgi:hypothetical protein